MKTLIILSAIPASGKSTWAKDYASIHPDTYIVSSDEIRVELTQQFNDHSRQKEVWELFSLRIHEYAKKENATVILDALNDLNVLRQKYVLENPEFDKYVLVLFKKDADRSLKLNAMRDIDKQVPKEAMLALIDKFEDVDAKTAQMFDEIINVSW